ncbi:MAG: M23 family metallopeptidase [Gemmatimonadetes bacterium]|nr:M23 family metallopeptidase [Gemmatimonadota bacterium]
MKMTTCVLAGIGALMIGGCAAGKRPVTPRPTVVRTERDVHAARVRESDPVPLRAWEDASGRALRSGLNISPSFRERIAFPHGDAHAIAYRFTLVRGQALRVSVTPAGAAGTVFADMFHHIGTDIFRPVHWVSQVSRSVGSGGTFVARADGEYVLRVQPPVGMTGIYDVAVLTDASLIFPVKGADAAAIGSGFGDPRERGARAHEGVDIFAPRGTPVLAATDGLIEKARNTPTGGLVIWQADAASHLTYYYAHLDELLVREGTYARAGDIIGTVGNTGNARGARPHLHFAVYHPGMVAVDPAPLLAARSELHDVLIAGHSLGAITRVSADRVRLRRSPSLAGPIITELSRDTPLLVLGDTGEWQRVVLPDGTSGFVAAHLTDSADAARQDP